MISRAKTTQIIFMCIIGSRAVTAQRSAKFSTLRLAGVPQCSVDTPAATFWAKSALQCSDQCLLSVAPICVAFNFRSTQDVCELFSEVSNNYAAISGCTVYQVRSFSYIIAMTASVDQVLQTLCLVA